MTVQAPTSLVVAAPAKVNLFLHVTGRRPDGYHTLESLFALVDFADTLTLERLADDVVLRTNDVPGVPAESDLALRAAHALKRATGTRQGVAVTVAKRIPQGAGLGGGSSDAASMLLALNRLWALDLPRARLAEIAATLGADVPFFVGGENAIARGIGDVLAPVTLPPLWLALVVPRVHVATAGIFAAPELTRSTPSAKIDVFSEGYGRNDLEVVTAREISGSRACTRRTETRGPTGAHDGLGGLRVRGVRAGRRCAARPRGPCAAPRRTSRPHARAPSARGIRAVVRKRGSPEIQVSAGESPSGKAPDFDSGIRRFDPYLPSHFRSPCPTAKAVRPRRLFPLCFRIDSNSFFPATITSRVAEPWRSNGCASSRATRIPSSRRRCAVI